MSSRRRQWRTAARPCRGSRVREQRRASSGKDICTHSTPTPAPSIMHARCVMISNGANAEFAAVPMLRVDFYSLTSFISLTYCYIYWMYLRVALINLYLHGVAQNLTRCAMTGAAKPVRARPSQSIASKAARAQVRSLEWGSRQGRGAKMEGAPRYSGVRRRCGANADTRLYPCCMLKAGHRCIIHEWSYSEIGWRCGTRRRIDCRDIITG